MGRTFVVAAVLWCVGNAPEAWAQLRLHEGARPSAMGGAFVAVADDAGAIAFNPAGLVYATDRWRAEFSVLHLFSSGVPFREDLSNDGVLAFSSFAAVYNHLRRPNRTEPQLVLAQDVRLAPVRQQLPVAPTTNDYSLSVAGGFLHTGLVDHLVLGFSVSKGFFEKSAASSTAGHLPHWLALSLTLKVNGLQYDRRIVEEAQVNSAEELEAIRDFFAVHGRGRWSLGLDGGVMFAPHPRVQAGLAWYNLVRPNLALEGTQRDLRRQRAGVALCLEQRRQWLLAMDFERLADRRESRFYLGTESGLPQIAADVLKLRLGANRNWVSAGFCLARPGLFELNYAFLFPVAWREQRPRGFVNHHFSLALSRPLGMPQP